MEKNDARFTVLTCNKENLPKFVMKVGDWDRRLDLLWELTLVEAYGDSLIKHHTIKRHVGVEVQLHTVFSSSLK
jgi:hypothetical protein